MIFVLLDINSALNSEAAAWIGAMIAVVLFGSNYVVTKQFPLGDGFSFQWFMGLGILLTGYACLFCSGDAIWVLDGMIGGALWAAGNSVVPVCINWTGLGISFLLWSITSLLVGWCVGKFGLFGVIPSTVATPWLNDLGPVFGILAMFVYVFIKPTLEEKPEEAKAILEDDYQHHHSINEGDENLLPPKKKFTLNANIKRIVGAAMALTVGLLYGVCLVPFQVWYQSQTGDFNALMFVISHYSGIFLMSSFVFVMYSIIKKNRPVIHNNSILPAMVSGVMWGVAQAGWMVSNGTLGMVIGYPIVVVGPMIINTLWAVLLYREIKGKKNLTLLAIALGLNIISVLCTALSYFSN